MLFFVLSFLHNGIAQEQNIQFSHESGIYDNFLALKLKSLNGHEIRFTLDGSDPTANDELFKDSLSVNSRYHHPDVLSTIKTGPRTPQRNKHSFKGWHIRAATFNNGERTSDIYTKIYFTAPDFEKKYGGFDVISIITDSLNLFDQDSGIYVQGKFPNDLSKANFNQRGRKWERPAHITLIKGHQSILIDQDIGIRIHGSTSRKNGQKSLRLYARSEYGKPVFEGSFLTDSISSYKKLVLRNSNSGWHKTIFKDELTTSLCSHLDIEVPTFLPVIVFINGEYWGIHSLRDYYCQENIALKFGVSKDSVNIVEHGTGHPRRILNGVIDGSATSHQKLYTILGESDLSKEQDYLQVSQIIDISSIIDFYCAELFFGNTDYIANNNRLWSIGKNGKWRQIFYDLDGGWSDPYKDPIQPLLNGHSSARYPNWGTFLFRTLWQSTIFRSAFLERLYCLASNDFNDKKLTQTFEQFVEDYLPAVKEHTGRWSVPGTVSRWKEKLKVLSVFAQHRSKAINDIIRKWDTGGLLPEKLNCY